MKKWIKEDNITNNPWHNDAHLLKFCRARKFEIEKVKTMFNAYMWYRQENDIDTIIDDY